MGRIASRFVHHCFPDCSTYIRFCDLFHFWVAPDGKKIYYEPLQDYNSPSLRHHLDSSLFYLQANVLSYSLLKMGIEPLHATAVVINGKAVAFIGDTQYGKSTLAASFLAAGHKLLTDDVLVLRKNGFGFMASPGAPQIKLFPKVARKILGIARRGVPMNPHTPKMILRLDEDKMQSEAVPLQAFFVLPSPYPRKKTKKVHMQRLTNKKGAVELLKAAYNLVDLSRERLSRQFHFTASVAEAVPIFSLSYPKDLRKLGAVREAMVTRLKEI